MGRERVNPAPCSPLRSHEVDEATGLGRAVALLADERAEQADRLGVAVLVQANAREREAGLLRDGRGRGRRTDKGREAGRGGAQASIVVAWKEAERRPARARDGIESRVETPGERVRLRPTGDQRRVAREVRKVRDGDAGALPGRVLELRAKLVQATVDDDYERAEDGESARHQTAARARRGGGGALGRRAALGRAMRAPRFGRCCFGGLVSERRVPDETLNAFVERLVGRVRVEQTEARPHRVLSCAEASIRAERRLDTGSVVGVEAEGLIREIGREVVVRDGITRALGGVEDVGERLRLGERRSVIGRGRGSDFARKRGPLIGSERGVGVEAFREGIHGRDG